MWGGIYFELAAQTEIPWCPLSLLFWPMLTNDLPTLLSAQASLKHSIKIPKRYPQGMLETLAIHAITAHGTVVRKGSNQRSHDADWCLNHNAVSEGSILLIACFLNSPVAWRHICSAQSCWHVLIQQPRTAKYKAESLWMSKMAVWPKFLKHSKSVQLWFS